MSTVALLHRDLEVAWPLAAGIAAVPGLTVQGIARDLTELRGLIAKAVPDLLIVDLMLPSGYVRPLLRDLCRPVRPRRPQVLVLALSADDPRIMEALKLGADGYFAHGPASPSLTEAVEQVLRGESAMTPHIAREVKSHFTGGGAVALTDADWRLLQWTAEGFLTGEVARALQLSAHGVGLRIRHIYRLLQDAPYPPVRALPAA
jgi:DNA-binding NarL/FixJ family response regulator